MVILFGYLFYFVYSTLYTLQFRWLMRESQAEPPSLIKFSFQVFCVLVLFSPLLLMFEPFRFSGDPKLIFLRSLVCGLCGALLTALAFFAQKHVEAGETTLVSNIYTPVAIILSS